MDNIKISLIVHSISVNAIRLTIKSKSKLIKSEYSIEHPFTQETLEKIKWYFEGSFKNPVHIASVENEIFDKGKLLFDRIFPQTESFTIELRKNAGSKLENLELEIIEKNNTHFFPWELLIDSQTDIPLVVTVKKFLRSFSDNEIPCLTHRGIIRVLLIIARPLAMADVHLRTIALSIRKVIQNYEKFEFTVLRPPTFKELTKVLEFANINKRPFNLIHFDGHGIHGSEIIGLDPVKGYLVFENEDGNSATYIDGKTLGSKLKENGTDVLIMNACRSGYVNTKLSSLQSNTEVSLAVDLFESGIGSVISMRYRIGVKAAMTFMQILYTALADGNTIEHSFHISRIKMLMEAMDREETLKLEMILPSLIQDRDTRFISEPKALIKFLKSFFQSSKKEKDRKYFLYFDNLTIEIEKLLRNHSIIIAWGAMGSGKSKFIIDFKYWALDTRLYEHVSVFDKSHYAANGFAKNIKDVQEIKNTCIILDDFDSLDDKLAIELLNEIKQNITTNVELNNKLIVVTKGAIPEQLGNYPNFQIVVSEQSLYDSLLKSARNYLPTETISKDEYEYFFSLTKGNILSGLIFQDQIIQASPPPSNFYKELNNLYSEKLNLASVSPEISSAFSKLMKSTQRLIGILHIFNTAFSTDLINQLSTVPRADINVDADLSILKKEGFLIQNEHDENIWQLHPLLVAKGKKIFLDTFNEKEIIEFSKIGEQWILSQYKSVFKRKVATKNFFSLLSFRIENKIQCDYTVILKLYRKEIRLTNVRWYLLLELFFDYYKDIIKGDEILNEFDKVNFLLFFHYYLEVNIYKGDLKNIYSLFEKWPKLDAQFFEIATSSNSNDVLLVYSDILYQLFEFEVNTSKVRPFQISEEHMLLPSLRKVKDILFERELFSKYASIAYILTEYKTCRTNNIVSWYYLTLQKKKRFSSDTYHPISVINTYLNRLVKYTSSNISGKKYEYLIGLSLLDFDKKQFTEHLVNLSFEEFVLGKIHASEISENLIQYEEVAKYGDSVLKEKVNVSRKVYFDTIQAKLLFCFLSEANLEILLDSGVSVSPSLILKFINEQIKLPLSQKEIEITSLVEAFLKSFAFENKFETDAYEDSLHLIIEGKFNQSISFLDELNFSIPTNDNPFSTFIKKYDLISYLYASSPLAAEIEFYGTSMSSYIRSQLTLLIEQFNSFAYNHDDEFLKYPEMEKELEKAGYVFGSKTDQMSNPKFLDIVKKYSPEAKNFLLEELNEKILLLKLSLDKEQSFLEIYFKILRSDMPGFDSMQQYSKYFKELDKARIEANHIRVISSELSSLLDNLDEFEVIALVSAIMSMASAKGSLTDYVEYIIRIERLLKLIHETGKPYFDPDQDIYKMQQGLEASYTGFISLLITIIVEAADTQYSIEDRRIALKFFDILERYEKYYSTFLPVPEIDNEFRKEKINSDFFKRTIKTVLLANQLTDITQRDNNSDSTYSWEIIEELNKIITTIPTITPDSTETEDFFNAILYEYQVHWSLSDMINNKFNLLPFGEIDKRLKILEKEYLSETSGFSKDLPDNITSRLARQINRKKLAAAITEAKETYSSHMEGVHDFIEEDQKPIQRIILKQLYE